MVVRKISHPFFFFREYIPCYYYTLILLIFVVQCSLEISLKRSNHVLIEKNNYWYTNNKNSSFLCKGRSGQTLLRPRRNRNTLASIGSSISKSLANEKRNKVDADKKFVPGSSAFNGSKDFNNANGNHSNHSDKPYNSNNEKSRGSSIAYCEKRGGISEEANLGAKLISKEKMRNTLRSGHSSEVSSDVKCMNVRSCNADSKRGVSANDISNASSVDRGYNGSRNSRVGRKGVVWSNILSTLIDKFWTPQGKKKNFLKSDKTKEIHTGKGIEVMQDRKGNNHSDNYSDNCSDNHNDNHNDADNGNDWGRKWDRNGEGESQNERRKEKENKNNESDKETNFLLKALDSGKFPSYCLVGNIDENADNFEIYMSKEKMDELNISDGFTVLLKGKKKKEMLGIAKVDKNLKKHYVVISFAMKKNLRLMHNDIIKIHPFLNVKKIRNVVISPFSDTVGNLNKSEIQKDVLNAYLKNSYKPLNVNSNIYINYKNKKIEFKILKIITEESDNNNEVYGCMSENSEITLSEEYLNREDYEEHNDDITYEDLGGMKKQLNKIRELIELPLKYPEIFMSIGISAPKGVLMHGIPGTGKTSIAKAIANESNAYCYIINGPEIMSKHIGESEQKLRKIFKKASEKTPCIIFIDEIDSIANKRSKSNIELEKRVVSQLLTLMDGLKKNNNVLVLAATNRPNAIDPALRRFGRFDREIEIPVPDEQGRYEILLTKTKKMKLDPDVNLRKIAKECHGYVGADLAQLCFEAAIQCIKEHVHFLDLDEEDFIEFMKISIDPKKAGDEEASNISSGASQHKEGSNNQLKNFFRFYGKGRGKLDLKDGKDRSDSTSGRSDDISSRRDNVSSRSDNVSSRSDNVGSRSDNVGSRRDNVGSRRDNLSGVADRVGSEKLDRRTKKIPSYILNKLTIKAKHFQHALNICNPSSLRERQVQIPTVTWSDIGGMHEVKEQLKETILYPLEYKHLYNKFNSNYNKGILLYGPPGCGKTLLAKAIANECNANFISVKGPELLTMWFGESEANVRDLFDKARAASPCIIFFDEIDSLAKERNSNNNNDASDRVINQILTEIDGINEKKTIFIIAATNRPDILDRALTRPGRLDKLIYISLPDFRSRCSIFKAILKNTPLNKDVDIQDMAKRTEGFSGADITNLCQSAVNEAIKETIHLLNIRKKEQKKKTNHIEVDPAYDPVPTLSKKHFDLAFKNARISIQPEDVLKYEKFKEKLSLQNFS
ncbi:AAA family ATPase, CDC48 subfamily, putative [Plasmodium malariae]|uniref:AAA family ATPase, CDC48 subfamily, putative n=1 Tax=Plasmodium malariae TaxID=5858 RepID=A0A1C3KL87_PLAMA|nr:AAA family ATPase, CDC48 subfamily, putative [Plasmodium malariae]